MLTSNVLLCVGLCLHNAYIGISPRGARFYALQVDARKALPESGVARVFRAVLRTVMRAEKRVTRPLLRAGRPEARGKMPEILKEVQSTEKY